MEVNNSIKCGVHDCKHHAGNVVNITVRQSRQSGVARATCPD